MYIVSPTFSGEEDDAPYHLQVVVRQMLYEEGETENPSLGVFLLPEEPNDFVLVELNGQKSMFSLILEDRLSLEPAPGVSGDDRKKFWESAAVGSTLVGQLGSVTIRALKT